MRRSFEERARKSALPNNSAKCAAIKFAVQRHGKGDLAASHYDVTAALPHTFEAVGNEQIAQLRAREEAQLRHASLRVL